MIDMASHTTNKLYRIIITIIQEDQRHTEVSVSHPKDGIQWAVRGRHTGINIT